MVGFSTATSIPGKGKLTSNYIYPLLQVDPCACLCAFLELHRKSLRNMHSNEGNKAWASLQAHGCSTTLAILAS